jgi:hypothetical protein
MVMIGFWQALGCYAGFILDRIFSGRLRYYDGFAGGSVEQVRFAFGMKLCLLLFWYVVDVYL